METALIIIDVQNDYFDGGAMPLVGAYKASENARLVLERFRTEAKPIIHVRHIAENPGATFFVPDTDGSKIHDNVKPRTNEKTIIKHYPNSFRDTELFDYLKNKNIENLVICGMQTHMCIDATVRAAKDFGFTIILIGDACATKDMEINGQHVKASDVQNSFLAALNRIYASVETSKKYLGE